MANVFETNNFNLQPQLRSITSLTFKMQLKTPFLLRQAFNM